MTNGGRPLTIALAGNPNSGKTTIFNHITGSRQHVGNYPGVTVEKKEGCCWVESEKIHVVDLPGTYSLTARSPEELAARHFIIDDRPDVIVDIIDASNIERNLYLYTQLMELNVPLVIALNMSDMAKARGIEFDLEQLSNLLGAPIVSTVGHKGKGVDELLKTVVAVARNQIEIRPVPMNLGRDIEKEIEKLLEPLDLDESLTQKYSPRWLAIKLLENDKEIWKEIRSTELREAAEQSAARIEQVYGDHPEIVIADQRYGIISGACQEAIRLTVEARHTYSDKIDEILTNRTIGVPIFLLLMYLVFQFTFTVGQYPVEWLENLFGWLGEALRSFGPADSENVLISLIVDGIIGGVGGVIVFVPNIFLLFLAIAVLEDTGYMARAAFNMDRYMHRIGLHGKSFIPMLIGFGCSVPAIMATRTLENHRDRYTTMMVIPLMSCGARLPIYTLIIPAFFAPAWQAPVLWLIYLIGVLLAVAVAKLLRGTLFKGENEPFIMELPPYRLPTLQGISIHVFERTWLYLKKAGTIILGISVVIWAMMSFPEKTNFDRDYDGELAQAESVYHSGVEGIAADLGLNESPERLIEALQNPTISESVSANQEFVDAVSGIRRARESFHETIENEGVEENTLDYAMLTRIKDSNLAKIEKANPNVYESAIQYIDSIEAPYLQTTVDLERAKHAEELSYSLAGRIGKGIEPLIAPLGFDWRIGTAFLGAFAAKEVFVAQLGIVFSLGEAEADSNALRQQLQDRYSPLSAFCIMLFCLVAMPCMATVAATKLETNSWKWPFLQLGGLTALGYVLTLVVYQTGRILGIGV